jgi:hypothetical protein
MVVSPDGSLRRSIFTDASLGFEAKCRSSNVNALPVYYRIPPMHVHNQSPTGLAEKRCNSLFRI